MEGFSKLCSVSPRRRIALPLGMMGLFQPLLSAVIPWFCLCGHENHPLIWCVALPPLLSPATPLQQPRACLVKQTALMISTEAPADSELFSIFKVTTLLEVDKFMN